MVLPMTKTVLVVGVGAIGSHAALFLRNAAHLRICDHDKVESKNVLSQFHPKQGVGKNKTVALAGAALYLFQTAMAAIPNKFSAVNADALLAGVDLVLDCTDNGAARRDIQAACQRLGVPCLHGALSADGTFGRAVWMEHFRIDNESADAQATCEDGENLPFHALAGAQVALIAQRFLNRGERISAQFTAQSWLRLA